jgi:nitrogen-specific signal transduction histidine kinase/ActR/RegA family two-component response regulator
MFCIDIDMRPLRQSEADRDKLKDQLTQAQKMEAIGTLAGGIAHDFNNILFPISGHAEILRQDIPEDSPLRESVDQIFSGAIRAADLVKQILTFSRQKPSELILLKLHHIVKEALKLLRSTIPTTIEIKQNINSTCGAVKADPTQIHQIIMNLVTNAYHSMEMTGGVLNISLTEIEFKESDRIDNAVGLKEYVCLIVKDTGSGMSKEIVEKIFDPFFTTKEMGKGTGLGLSVVHGIVKSLGGFIDVNSEVGVGSEFKVYFPTEKENYQEEENNSELSVQGGDERILLVDDEESIVLYEKNMLERLGYKISSFTNSVDALEAFEKNPEKYDLIISDVTMPILSGEKLALEMMAIRSDIPILLCTGYSNTIDKEKVLNLGIHGFLMKPVTKSDMAKMVRNILDLTES